MSTRDDSRVTHPLNVGYLVVGLVCLGMAGLWALHAADVVDTAQVGWLLPLTLVVAGAIGLVALALRGLTRVSGGGDDPYVSDEQPYYDAYDHVTDLATLQASAFRYPTSDEPGPERSPDPQEPEGSEEAEATTVLSDAGPDAEEPTTRIPPEGES